MTFLEINARKSQKNTAKRVVVEIKSNLIRVKPSPKRKEKSNGTANTAKNIKTKGMCIIARKRISLVRGKTLWSILYVLTCHDVFILVGLSSRN